MGVMEKGVGGEEGHLWGNAVRFGRQIHPVFEPPPHSAGPDKQSSGAEVTCLYRVT